LGIQGLIGQQFGPYELRELIGIGGMSAVYRARGDVAVKVLLPALTTTYADQFDRMARIRLTHPHIVPIIDSGTQDNLHYIVMPLLTGGTMADPIHEGVGLVEARGQSKPCPYENVINLLLPLASALDYAHEQGVIHGDIKPGNVLFDDRGNVLLSDFGSSGTPTFMAPEVCRGEPSTPVSDQYALGVLAYLLLTGRFPFDAPSRSALKDKHLNKFPISPRDYSPTLPESAAAAVLRALAKSPDERFPTVTAFIQAFEQGI
jgi:serine/threonine-protein kinase